MLDLQTLALVAAIFLLAGSVKGVVGFGLPAVGLSLLTLFLELPAAMAVMLLPAIFTNLLQGLTGGYLIYLIKRLWPFLAAALATVFVGAQALHHIDHRWLVMLLGAIMVLYAIVSLSGLKLSLSQTQERWAGPPIGLVNGVIAGMTGVFVIPSGLFLQSIGLAKNQLVQALGLYFVLSEVMLALALGHGSFITQEIALLSAAAIIPAFAGMFAGKRLRDRIPEAAFRKVFLTMLGLIGGYLILSRALGPL